MAWSDLLAATGSWVSERAGSVFLVQSAVLGVLVLWVAALTRRLRRLRAHYHALARDVDGRNLEELLHEHLRRLRDVRREVDELADGLQSLGERQRRCVQRVGLVRYDAFEDVGGQASFAVAVLDDHRDGFVINSVFGRDASTTYAKPVTAGRSDVPLSDEEVEAVRRALESDQ